MNNGKPARSQVVDRLRRGRTKEEAESTPMLLSGKYRKWQYSIYNPSIAKVWYMTRYRRVYNHWWDIHIAMTTPNLGKWGSRKRLQLKNKDAE